MIEPDHRRASPSLRSQLPHQPNPTVSIRAVLPRQPHCPSQMKNLLKKKGLPFEPPPLPAVTFHANVSRFGKDFFASLDVT